MTEEDSDSVDELRPQNDVAVKRVIPMDYNSAERKHFNVVQLDDERPGFISRAE